ncbi:ABC transporter permease [Actinophytocola oryzae]|uniref:ABC-2 type transport system permease protein n=1 Tax=Actinophytocola oryzae TaxID=502181 RepID=A0A4R7VWX7_9PSEU|nr:ABC transporter permease [Actinophytocola oryzae]TDV54155.1 ABC-2 type transport system permease protein [Actinophytocola oryzae]
MSFTYLILEVRRAMRNGRFLVFSIAFPVLLFLLYVGIFADGDKAVVGILMVNMTAFGALSASLFAGGRVALERQLGWQRQLRLTPLSGSGYLAAKGITGMMLAIPAVVLVPLIGAVAEGVSLDAAGWLRVTVGIWLAVIPFALIGLFVGQIGTPESMQPIMSITMMAMSLLGGIFIPIDTMPGWLTTISHLLPSYWLGQVGRGAVTSSLSVDLGQAVLVLAGWTLVLGFAVIRRYRRDSARV